jgi:hypothetical protein
MQGHRRSHEHIRVQYNAMYHVVDILTYFPSPNDSERARVASGRTLPNETGNFLAGRKGSQTPSWGFLWQLARWRGRLAISGFVPSTVGGVISPNLFAQQENLGVRRWSLSSVNWELEMPTTVPTCLE